MLPGMAYTESDLAVIDDAIKSGTKRVTIDGRTVEYASMADLIRARNLIRKELAGEPAGSRCVRTCIATFDDA